MNNQTGCIQADAQRGEAGTVHNEEGGFLAEQMHLLFEVREQLEPANLRSHTEQSLNFLVLQLQEIIREFRFTPPDVVESYVTSKKTLLTEIQNATIKLIMALDQLTMKGQTTLFYKHLVTCQEYLDAAATCWRSSPLTLRTGHHEGTPKAPQGSLLMHARRYAEALDAAQASMAGVSFDDETVAGGQFDQLPITLNTTLTSVWELKELLNRDAYTLDKSISYGLRVNLSYLEDQIPRVLTMIKTFRASPRRVRKTSQEIAYKLRTISQSCRDVSQALTDLLKQARPHVRKENSLRLIYSSVQAPPENEGVS
jgi:hypothetical protein